MAKLSLDPSEIAEHFKGKCNLAIVLGQASGGLVDIDLDVPEAVRLAPHFLPKTSCMFGHKSSPASHYVYQVDGNPKTVKRQIQNGEKSQMILEHRARNAATVFPPAVH